MPAGSDRSYAVVDHSPLLIFLQQVMKKGFGIGRGVMKTKTDVGKGVSSPFEQDVYAGIIPPQALWLGTTLVSSIPMQYRMSAAC
jgi:hypothetical protein